MGLTAARSAEVICLAVTWAVLDATMTASTSTEDALATAEQVVEKVNELAETSSDRLRHCAVKTAAHAAACAKALQGEAAAAPKAAAAAATQQGQKQKLPLNDVQGLAVLTAARAATSNAMSTCCSLEEAVLQAGQICFRSCC